jgi:hypothetical protein
MRPDLDLAEPIILHLANSATEDSDNRTFEDADLILAQLTTDAFKPAHLSTSLLRHSYGARVIVWPNIFFAGQQPYLRYFTNLDGSRMVGPFEAMHDLRLFGSWLRTGRVVPNTVFVWNADELGATVRESLHSLTVKEALTDVIVTDLIQDRHETQSLFFTFNHPRRTLLAEVARRLLVKAGLAPTHDPVPQPEPLGRYRVPGIGTADDLRGDSIGTKERKATTFALPELCAAFQALYDGNVAFRNPDRIRLTPQIGWETAYLTKT